MKTANYSLTVSPLELPKNLSIKHIFSHFSNKSWAMLLDSADSNRQDGRFDIIVADPIATITTTGKISKIRHSRSNGIQDSSEDPLSLVTALLKQYMPSQQILLSDDSTLPFLAGALGYFGYDLGKQFESLPDKNADEYSTADMAVGIYSWSIIKDNSNQQFYLCYLDHYPHPSNEDIVQLAKAERQAQSFVLKSHWQANMTQSEYAQKLQKISDYLIAGDCYQINLAQRFEAQYDGDEWHAYLQLCSTNQAPFSAFIRVEDNVIISISPERFISIKDGVVQSKPIKGTRPRSDDIRKDKQQIESLLGSEKDRAENLMIVDLLRNDLSKHCQPASVNVPELFSLESFAAVHHLVSTVTGTLKPTSHPMDLIRGAFPGGSITGAPKIRAMEIINKLEPNNRNIYCGSIGYLGVLGDMDTNICIRTLLCENNAQHQTIFCWAGGGIVLDSNSEDEYQESLDKVSKILPVLCTNFDQSDIQ